MNNLLNFYFSKIKKSLLKNKDFLTKLILVILFFAVGLSLGNALPLNKFSDKVKSFFEGVKVNLPDFSRDKDNLSTLKEDIKEESEYSLKISYEQAIIEAVKGASPSVVSIIITKDLPVYERELVNPFEDFGIPGFEVPQYVQRGTKKQEVGSGSGFIVSEDGLVLTNKHVVIDQKAEYTVFTNDGKKFPAKVLALDPFQDIAIIKIESSEKFKAMKLGDSSKVQIGQTAITIGNALGKFRNTVSVGVISGLDRTVFATGGGSFSETLQDIIQTDAAINRGNSGGPLLNLQGQVIGINTAMAEDAQAVGFAIPINMAKKDIEQVFKGNKIVYPFLGIRYVAITPEIQEQNKLPVDNGAWVRKGENGERAITKDSAADKAGIKSEDIILEFGGEKVTRENSLAEIIRKYSPGDKVKLKILRDGKEIEIEVILGERS